MEAPLPVLGIIIPCYNEEEVIAGSMDRLLNLLRELTAAGMVAEKSFIALVDDRSRDRSWEIIKGFCDRHRPVRALRLAGNRGHQYALLAGLFEFSNEADCLVTLDADLQDDISVIGKMVEKYRQGNEVVIGVRNKRPSDTPFKRFSAYGFYKLMNLFGVEVVHNHADFRLTSRRVNEELKKFPEVNLFLRGVFPLIGFNTAIVYYERAERLAGKTKYPLKRMISLALDGITSFSTAPLRFITFVGFLVFLICLFLMGYALWAYLAGRTIAGWFSTVLPFYFLGGVQILCIGILGEYLGKIYKEVKRRPRYIVDERI